jgi:RiboL-PSP-HEPN
VRWIHWQVFRYPASWREEHAVPSASLQQWQSDRMPRLHHFELQCLASLAAVPRNAQLIEENLRGYVVLLSAHFQGFCRDLCTEAAQIIASKVRPTLAPLIQNQFTAHRKLDRGNANLEHLKLDFDRFGLDLKHDLKLDAANVPRLADLTNLNRWRNAAAHQGAAPGNIPLDVASLHAWRASCDGLATSLDNIVYNHLSRLLRRSPW